MRLDTPPRTLLVLGGGGAMGAYQAGALLALARSGVLPDALFGCSAGGLNAAFFAVDPSVARAEELRQWWLDRRTHSLLSASWLARARGVAGALTTGRSGLFDAGPLRRLIAENVPAHDLCELRIPLTVTTTCLDCAMARHHDRGSVIDILTASCALPGLLPPVPLTCGPGRSGHLHVDGGVLCGVPLVAALATAGPRDRVLVLDCGLAPVTSAPGGCAAYPAGAPALVEEACGLVAIGGRSYVAPVESSRGAMDVVLRAFTAARAVANLAHVAPGLGDPRVRVLPHIADAWAAGVLDVLPEGPRDFRRTGDLAAAGASATERWLAGGGLERASVVGSGDGIASA
ncbi:MAG: patatin-like phospholipase family protein [Geodermatophilaceae bacterium]|nr:patatin-like phospholipase family protein [Geodermatophilaceae bacterium]